MYIKFCLFFKSNICYYRPNYEKIVSAMNDNTLGEDTILIVYIQLCSSLESSTSTNECQKKSNSTALCALTLALFITVPTVHSDRLHSCTTQRSKSRVHQICYHRLNEQTREQLVVIQWVGRPVVRPESDQRESRVGREWAAIAAKHSFKSTDCGLSFRQKVNTSST